MRGVDVDDAVVEALYEYGCTGIDSVLRYVRRRFKNVDDKQVRQCYNELRNKQRAIFQE
jgi:hypothetical protein